MNLSNQPLPRHAKLQNFMLNILFHTENDSEPFDIATVKRIFLIHYAPIGDLVMRTPFYKALRRTVPNAYILLLTSECGKAIFEGENLIDNIVVLDSKYAGSKNMLAHIPAIRAITKSINSVLYDVAIDLSSALWEMAFMRGVSAKRHVGYSYCGGLSTLSYAYDVDNEISHFMYDYLHLAKSLGCVVKDDDDKLTLSVSPEMLKICKSFITANGIDDQTIVGIHPGSSMLINRWDKYVLLIQKIHENVPNVKFLIFEGPSESDCVNPIITQLNEMNVPYILVKRIFKEYLSILLCCSVIICNDSSCSHLAAAYGVPEVVIYGRAIPEITKPHGKNEIVCVSHNFPCKPCFNTNYCEFYNRCIKRVNVDEVYAHVLKIIKGTQGDKQ